MVVNKSTYRVVVVGAGFGGFQAAQSLAVDKRLDITLVDRHGRHVFTPLIYQVATGILTPDYTIAQPESHLPERVRVLTATVERVDFDERQVISDQGTLPYDFLVLATGATPQIVNIPGARQHAMPMGTLSQAIALRQRLAECLIQAGPGSIPSVVIVGGGTTGAELSGALAEWARLLGKEMTIHLIHGGDEMLQEFAPRLGKAARSRLERIGVTAWMGTRVQEVTEHAVRISGDRLINADLVIWTAGTSAAVPELSAELGVGRQGRLQIRPTLQVRNRNLDQVYAIGDVSINDGSASGESANPPPAVAPPAQQQGVVVARNIRRQISGKPLRSFSYLNKGRLAIVGGYLGVGKIAGITISGILARAMWLGVHWVYLPGLKNRWGALKAWWRTYGPGASRLPLEQILSGPPTSQPSKPSSKI